LCLCACVCACVCVCVCVCVCMCVCLHVCVCLCEWLNVSFARLDTRAKCLCCPSSYSPGQISLVPDWIAIPNFCVARQDTRAQVDRRNPPSPRGFPFQAVSEEGSSSSRLFIWKPPKKKTPTRGGVFLRTKSFVARLATWAKCLCCPTRYSGQMSLVPD